MRVFNEMPMLLDQYTVSPDPMCEIYMMATNEALAAPNRASFGISGTSPTLIYQTGWRRLEEMATTVLQYPEARTQMHYTLDISVASMRFG